MLQLVLVNYELSVHVRRDIHECSAYALRTCIEYTFDYLS